MCSVCVSVGLLLLFMFFLPSTLNSVLCSLFHSILSFCLGQGQVNEQALQWAKTAPQQQQPDNTTSCSYSSSSAVAGTPPRIRLGSESPTSPLTHLLSSSTKQSPRPHSPSSNDKNGSADREGFDSSSSSVNDQTNPVLTNSSTDSKEKITAKSGPLYSEDSKNSDSNSRTSVDANSRNESSSSSSRSNSDDEWVSRDDILMALKEARPLYPEAKLKVMYGLVDPHAANQAKRAQLEVMCACVWE